MDLANNMYDACASLPEVKVLLNSAKFLSKTIDQAEDNAARVDSHLYDVISSTDWSQQPRGTTTTTTKPLPAFQQLLAAFEATVDAVATPAQKKKRDSNPHKQFNYNLTNFLHRMSPQQRRALKLALHADTTAIIATARRNATDAVPKLFDGALLPSTSTAEARKALDALYAEAQEQQSAIARRIAALNRADAPLTKIDEGLVAADAFEADGSLVALMMLGPSSSDDDAPLLLWQPPTTTATEKEEELARDAKRAKH